MHGSDKLAVDRGGVGNTTGGSFLAVDSFDPDSPKASAFLDAVWQSGPQERFERQRRYELDVDTAERFDWYTALPPPSR